MAMASMPLTLVMVIWHGASPFEILVEFQSVAANSCYFQASFLRFLAGHAGVGIAVDRFELTADD